MPVSPKSVVVTLKSFYGLIYGGIAIIILAAMLIAPKQLVFYTNQQTAKLSLLQQPISLNVFTCTFKKITGIPCLTCGGTRSSFYFAHLRLWQSFKMNPLVFLLFAVILLYGILSIGIYFISQAKEIKISIPRWLKRIIFILLIGSIFINWIYLIFISKP